MKEINKRGLDWGFRTENMDRETMIRLASIPEYKVCQAWADLGEITYPECEHGCDGDIAGCECEGYEPTGAVYKTEEYFVHQGRDASDLWVEKSPYVTFAQFCSPCAPGACYLPNPIYSVEPGEDLNFCKLDFSHCCYCLHPDWFDNIDEEDKCPYPVWEWATGKLIYTPEHGMLE